MFLDDLHVLKSQGPLRTLAQFIAHAPANLHFVLASREEPNLPLARSRVQGSCLEVTTEELRFSENEMASFMAMNGHAISTWTRSAHWRTAPRDGRQGCALPAW